MKRLLFIILTLLISSMAFSQRSVQLDFDRLTVYHEEGLISITKEIILGGNVKVVSSPSEADLFVYVTTTKYYSYLISKSSTNSSKPLHWHFVNSNPDFTVYFVKDEDYADITIRYAN